MLKHYILSSDDVIPIVLAFTLKQFNARLLERGMHLFAMETKQSNNFILFFHIFSICILYDENSQRTPYKFIEYFSVKKREFFIN